MIKTGTGTIPGGLFSLGADKFIHANIRTIFIEHQRYVQPINRATIIMMYLKRGLIWYRCNIGLAGADR